MNEIGKMQKFNFENCTASNKFLYIQSNYKHVPSMQFSKQALFKSHFSQTAKAIILFYLVCKLHIDQSLNTVYNSG